MHHQRVAPLAANSLHNFGVEQRDYTFKLILSACINDLVAWCASRRLKLNASKTELIWFSSRTTLGKMATDRSVTVGSVDVQPTDIVRNLGVLC